MAKRSCISPTLTVFGIWWVTTTYLSPTHDWDSSGRMLIIVLFGIFLGMVAAVTAVAVLRKGYRTIVAPTELRGLRCSIGEVPLPMPEPSRAEELPSVSPVTMPDIPADFVDNWLDEYASEYPHHAALFKALLLVLNHRPDLPATHVPGGHGGRTLLQHSMLTAWIMTEVSKDWKYDGLRDRTGKKIVVPLRDENYAFIPHDPMVAIIGLAHDIGKIESFIYNDRGEVVGIRSEHDLTGSRMVARMQEAWDVPAEDRDAMLLAIAHYHHPVELPMAPGQRKLVARDDRTIALMELLIRADFTVTSIETRGVVPTEDEYRSLDSVRVASPEQIYEEFVALIHEAHRINSGNIKYSVGQISPAPDNKGALLYLHEESLRTHMLRRLNLQSTTHLGNGRYQLTVDLLNVLKVRGILYTTHENLDYSAGNAMWVCDVLGSKSQKVASWPCVIAVKVEHFEKLQQLGFFSSSIKILRNRFGTHMGRQVKDGQSDTRVLGGLGSNNDIPDAPATPKKKAGVAKPANQGSNNPRMKPEVPIAPSDLAMGSRNRSERVEPVLPNMEAVAVAEDAPEQDQVEHIPSNPGGDNYEAAPQDGKSPPDAGLLHSYEAGKEAAEVPKDELETSVQPETNSDSRPSHSVKNDTACETVETATGESAVAGVPSDIDANRVASALMLAISHGESGKLKCHKGASGNIVFNLDTLLAPDSLAAKPLSAPGVLDLLASGKLKGVSVTRIKSATLVSLTPPISCEA